MDLYIEFHPLLQFAIPVSGKRLYGFARMSKPWPYDETAFECKMQIQFGILPLYRTYEGEAYVKGEKKRWLVFRCGPKRKKRSLSASRKLAFGTDGA